VEERIRDMVSFFAANRSCINAWSPDISSTLTSLLLSFLAYRTLLSDTYIILHAAFIGGLARIIGNDFGMPRPYRLGVL
jgi:hypothetical protein